MNQKEQWYADTIEEADEIVTDGKDEDDLVKHAISEKHNKYGTYYLVDLQFSYHTPRELMEDEAAKKERENQGSQHDGVSYSVNDDGTVSVPDGQMSIDEMEDEE